MRAFQFYDQIQTHSPEHHPHIPSLSGSRGKFTLSLSLSIQFVARTQTPRTAHNLCTHKRKCENPIHSRRYFVLQCVTDATATPKLFCAILDRGRRRTRVAAPSSKFHPFSFEIAHIYPQQQLAPSSIEATPRVARLTHKFRNPSSVFVCCGRWKGAASKERKWVGWLTPTCEKSGACVCVLTAESNNLLLVRLQHACKH